MSTQTSVRAMPFSDLMVQWEPKLQKMSKWWIPYLDTEDVWQELLLVLWKCQQKYREDTAASFHTYLHRAMLNRLGQLTAHVKRHNPLPERVIYLSQFEVEESRVGVIVPPELQYQAEDSVGLLLSAAGLDTLELTWAIGKTIGLTMKEIMEIAEIDAKKLKLVRKSAIDKMNDLREDIRNAGTTKEWIQKSRAKS